MHFVYPPNPHHTAESSAFFIGSVSPDASLWCNGQAVPVSAEGFVAHSVALLPGENQVVWQVDSEPPQTYSVTRPMPQADSLWVEPDSLWVMPGESLQLRCLAPEGTKVWAQIGSLQVSLIQSEQLPSNQTAIFGTHHQVEAPYASSARQFVAQVLLPSSLPVGEFLPVTYSACLGEVESAVNGGDLTVLDPLQMPWGTVNKSDAICRVFPPDGERLTPLWAGTRLAVTGKRQKWVRFAHCGNSTAWIHEDDVLLDSLVPSAPAVYQPLDFIQCQPSDTGVQLVFPLAQPVPFEVKTSALGLQISLAQTPLRCDVIRYQPGVQEAGLEEVQALPLSESTTLVSVSLDSPLLGVSWQHTGQALVFDIRLAQALTKRPWVVALDAGHGGTETGATAPDGTLEKDLNAQMAHRLWQMLHNAPDFQPVLIREGDEPLTLAQRTQKARSLGADILLSLHHNALPDGRNPMAESGVSSYYYHSFAKPLAKAIQQALVANTDFEDYGLLMDNLHMCRETAMPSVLLELGFVTHPQDAALILDDAHQHRVAQAIVLGLQHYRGLQADVYVGLRPRPSRSFL